MNVYLDNASTTNVSLEVFEAMKPFFLEQFANPSSLHDNGIHNRKVVNQARKKIANLLHCSHKEIHFTSCGTESINWAIKGLAFGNHTKGEIITTKIEHHATLHAVAFLEQLGYIVHYLDVDKEGFIDVEQLKSLVNNNTLLVSVIMANNEIGTIQKIDEIAAICDEARVYLHLDAVQAVCHTELNLETLGCDLLSISAHKFHGPKGVGILYIKEGTKIVNLLHGGQQEHGLRAGTENVPYIVGIATALEHGITTIPSYENRLNEYANYILKRLDEEKIDYLLNGTSIGKNRLPGNLNLSFKGIDGSSLTYYLNKAGIAVSTGSACDSKSIEPSHVLKAIKVPDEYIKATIRISIGSATTFDEVAYATNTLILIIKEEIED